MKILFTFVSLLLLSFSTYSQNSQPNEKRMFIEDEKNSMSVFQTTAPSVVNVSTYTVRRSFFGYGEKTESGGGSGFVWDEKGHIVTNYHVVATGGSFKVSFHNDRKQYEAKVVGVEPNRDLAVLRLKEKPASPLKPIKVGRSSDLAVGQKAIAIGNPFGLDHTMTSGIISALGREFPSMTGVKINNAIQTDASINPGNSGGPLLDSSGNLIGVNTMIFSTSGASAGIGMAIPVDEVKRIVPQLINNGKVSRPSLGITIVPDNYRDYSFGLDKGIIIESVDPKGPAGKAGLKGLTSDREGYYLGDVIVSLGGNEVNNYNDIYNALDKFKAGDAIDVGFLRNGKKITTKITLK